MTNATFPRYVQQLNKEKKRFKMSISIYCVKYLSAFYHKGIGNNPELYEKSI